MNVSIQPPSLAGKAVFLSASFPHPERSPKYFGSADQGQITQAVVSLGRAVFKAGGRLIFGGHPTISPLIMMVAEEYMKPASSARQIARREQDQRVFIYQSKVFDGKLSAPVTRLLDLRLGELIQTDPAPGERPDFINGALDPESVKESLAIMRERMLDPEESNPSAAVFIGGMEGIHAEIEIFRARLPNRPTYCVGGPGGAARELAREPRNLRFVGRAGLTGEDLAGMRQYPVLMQHIVRDISGVG